MDFEQIYCGCKEESLQGRYITNTHIEPLLEKLKSNFEVTVEGTSVLGKPVYTIKAGSGKTRIFIWSQMHGNESTTTKAIFDFLNFLAESSTLSNTLKNEFTWLIVPIANPDGAAAYTRENADGVDLNRDAFNLSQPESKILRKLFDGFMPHYCYNMHDQRTIFGAGATCKPATVSFLAPAYNESRDINGSRQKAINVIAAMNDVLQAPIPGQVGRFDDMFNINCIGDMFQYRGTPTILFEAGHYQNDYNRETTRKYIFIALLSGFNVIYENAIGADRTQDYFDIPQNKIIFYDFIYRNVKINYENTQKITNFAAQYKEVLFEDSVMFEAYIEATEDVSLFYGHTEYDCEGGQFQGTNGESFPKNGMKADFLVLPAKKFVNGLEKK